MTMMSLSRLMPTRLAPHLVTRSASTSSGFDRNQILKALNGEHLRAGQAEPTYVNSNDKLTFYNMRFCMYAQRTALVLLAKEIE